MLFETIFKVQNNQRKEAVTVPKVKVKSSSDTSRRMRPALSPEARENQMISYAVDLAEQQLLDGTASSQVITHYLKLGSTKEKLEMEKLREENKLIRAKVENLQAQAKSEELFEKAINAMRSYSGHVTYEEDEDFDD